jgi:hypothetical protein
MTMGNADAFIPPIPFSAALFVGMLACMELGRRLGKWRIRQDPKALEGLGVVDGAVFGLYGLLIAFVFLGAPARFDARRNLIAQETNAVGTAYLRLDLLPPDAQPALRELFRRYLDSRLEFTRSANLAADREIFARSGELQQQIWNAAVAATRRPEAHPDAGKLLIPALNDMIDITTTRLMAVRTHPPHIVYGLLFVLALVCASLAGFGMAGSTRRSWIHILSFALISVITVYTILDIEYPRIGLVRLDAYDDVMADLRATMK